VGLFFAKQLTRVTLTFFSMLFFMEIISKKRLYFHSGFDIMFFSENMGSKGLLVLCLRFIKKPNLYIQGESQ